MSTITDYHAKYLAYELTRRHASDSDEKFAGTLVDAQVDANPHQIDAALFAFKSPLATGALLADEVGLGKTIEAGLVISQKWAERKRRILIIVPASLRKQWSLEMAEKFFVPCSILETKSYNQIQRGGQLAPFESDRIVICSYEFARRKANDISNIPWDLVVLDEAHRLRNVYKGNQTASMIKLALQRSPKLLLTATPLQNSLNELYGLVSMIDEYTFGDLESFKVQFGSLQTDADFMRLRERIKPICHRTLRKQVLPYIKYTRREAILEEFVSSDDEDALYDLVSEYLRRDNLKALPNSQRALITMVLRKLLASSTDAIASALDTMANRLRKQIGQQPVVSLGNAIAEDFETYDEIEDEEDGEDEGTDQSLSESDRRAIEAELRDLDEFVRLARSIHDNAKGKALLVGLRRALQQAQSLGAARKAIVFTESRKTQLYIQRLLLGTPEFAEGIVLFNGTNNDEDSKRIYNEWVARHRGTERVTGSRSADMRAALVEYFRDQGQIMIATESAAEGINLQFCSLVVNYDLPWNPQRIEQRIGRCHRYGQKHDVVVLNFLNQKNEADKRVYQLLAEKFQLFQGVFGASDEVLSTIESGLSFEKRIADIYQRCRTPEQITEAFVQLQMDLSDTIQEEVTRSRNLLLENFDDEVAEKLRLIETSSGEQIGRYEQRLMAVTRHELRDLADFEGDAFKLRKAPPERAGIPTGRYELPRRSGDAYLYRLGHPLAEAVLERAKKRVLPVAELIFDLSAHRGRIAALDEFKGASGWLAVRNVTIAGAQDAEDWLVLAAVADDGRVVDNDICPRMFSLPSRVSARGEGLEWTAANRTVAMVVKLLREREQEIIERAMTRSSAFLDEESTKLDLWAEDRKKSLRLEMHEIDKQIKELKREAKLAGSLPEQIAIKRKIQLAITKRDDAEMNFRSSSREVERRQSDLLDEIEKRLLQESDKHDLFQVRWRLV